MTDPYDAGDEVGARRLSYATLAPVVNRTESLWRSRHGLDGETASSVAHLAGARLDVNRGGAVQQPELTLARAVDDTVALWRKLGISQKQSAEVAEIACARLQPRSSPTPAPPLAADLQRRPAGSQKKHCKGTTVYGTRCGRPAVGSSEYCRWCLPSHGGG